MLRLAPGNLADILQGFVPLNIPVPGARLVVIFLVWAPILFVAAYLSFGLGQSISVPTRFTVLGVHAAALIACVLIGGELASEIFDLLLRFAPVPTMIFLFADGRRHWSKTKCIGFALIFFDLWRSLYFSVPDLITIAGGGAVARPLTTLEMYRNFFLKFLWEFTFPILGLFFFTERVPGIHIAARWGRNFENAMRSIGAWLRRPFPFEVALGCVFFSLNVAGLYLLAWALANSPTQDVGDDSRVFDFITVDQVFLLSIMAGVGEELVFRGLLQRGLHQLVGRGLWTGTIVILIQALAFSVVHAGYTDLDHVISPLLFGVFAGVVYRFWGLWPIIYVHIAIDVVAFGYDYAGLYVDNGIVEATHPAMAAFLGFFLIANLGVALVYVVYQIIRWFETTRKAIALIARA